MAKWLKSILCLVLAVAALTLTEVISGFFQTCDYSFCHPEYESLEIIDKAGVPRKIDPDMSMIPWDWQEGETFRGVCRLPTVEESPELYDDGFISFMHYAAQFVLLIDGQEVYRTVYSVPPPVGSIPETQVSILPEWSGAELTVLMTPTDPDWSTDAMCNLLYINFSNYRVSYASIYALGNRNAMPAGSYSMIFLLVFVFFLVSVIVGKPDWSLLVLSIMAGITFFWYLLTNFGYFFLPDSKLMYLDYRQVAPVLLVLAIVYLFLNRQGEFWKRLGTVLLVTVLCIFLVYLCMLLVWRERAMDMRDIFVFTLQGYIPPLWLIPYMTVMCGSVSFYNIIRIQFTARSEARAMTIRQNMLADSYRAMEQRFTETASLRHDWKNQITALNLLYQEGELEKLGQRLQDMDSAVDSLRLPVYSECFIVNSILQSFSVKAGEEGVDFRASAPLPNRIGMDEGDICSFFINMLDNALEASSQVPEGKRRFIDLTVKINQGFLAVCCRNSCKDRVEMENGALPETTKSRDEGHGLGLRQMEQIARRYGSKLDLACDNEVFTVQTAFKLKKADKKAPAEAGAGV